MQIYLLACRTLNTARYFTINLFWVITEDGGRGITRSLTGNGEKIVECGSIFLIYSFSMS